VLALAAVSLLLSEKSTVAANDPWLSNAGWRMNAVLHRQLDFADETRAYPVTIGYLAQGWTVQQGDMCTTVVLSGQQAPHLTSRLTPHLTLQVGDLTVSGDVVRDGDLMHVFTGGVHTTLTYADPLAHAGEAEAEGGRLTAPMPGKIVAVLVAVGESVEKGAPLLIMEAMKMEHTIAAPTAGVVAELLYAIGDQVGEGAQLLSFKVA
jgi:3-methylcrotonyl-CoA carboxylase alpha subunit